MWVPASGTRHIIPPEFYLLAPASSFQHHPEASIDPNPANSVGVGVIPLLAASPSNDYFYRGWQHQQRHNLFTDPTKSVKSIDQFQTGEANTSLTGATTCKDCGNQAKKDCAYKRCRSCCTSRGYDCSTHVKSTWVPAARRRERKLKAEAAGSSHSTSGVKKPRLAGASASPTTTSNTSPPRSFDTSSSQQEASLKDALLPGHVRAPAVFKCVRVTALDDGEDEYAYQAVVRIGGRVFKGFLYDQGAQVPESSTDNEFPNISELQLGGGGGVASSSPNVDNMYTGLLGGTSYGDRIS